MIEPIKCEIEVPAGRWNYLWLKRVERFQPSVHCARCLVGAYAPFLGKRILWGGGHAEGIMDAHGADSLYLCGVHRRGYNQNLHIPITYSLGDVVEFDEPDLSGRFVNAIRHEVVALPTPTPMGLGTTAAFTTCRNYQWGYQRFGLPEPTGRLF